MSVPNLGEIAARNEENDIIKAFMHVHSMPELTSKAQNIVNADVILRSELREKRARKVALAGCGSDLQAQIVWPLIILGVDELCRFWSKKEITASGTYPKKCWLSNFFK